MLRVAQPATTLAPKRGGTRGGRRPSATTQWHIFGRQAVGTIEGPVFDDRCGAAQLPRSREPCRRWQGSQGTIRSRCRHMAQRTARRLQTLAPPSIPEISLPQLCVSNTENLRARDTVKPDIPTTARAARFVHATHACQVCRRKAVRRGHRFTTGTPRSRARATTSDVPPGGPASAFHTVRSLVQVETR